MVDIQCPISCCRSLMVDYPLLTISGPSVMVGIQWPMSSCRPLKVYHARSTMVGRLVMICIQWPMSSCRPLVDHPWSTIHARPCMVDHPSRSSISIIHVTMPNRPWMIDHQWSTRADRAVNATYHPSSNHLMADQACSTSSGRQELIGQ